jgi:hypothetical protein
MRHGSGYSAIVKSMPAVKIPPSTVLHP